MFIAQTKFPAASNLIKKIALTLLPPGAVRFKTAGPGLKSTVQKRTGYIKVTVKGIFCN